MLFAPLFMGCDNHKVGHTLVVDKGVFLLDSARFTVASVELGYSRHPREYWPQILGEAKNLGANTIMVRVPWFLHEPNEGEYDFAGNNDVREFCRLAHEAGLLVWLHVGPYSDAHADMGGMPWWLLKYENMQLRTQDTLFMKHAGRFFRTLGTRLADMQLQQGGPIALVHIEEPHGLQDDTKNYLSALCDSVRAAGFDTSLLTLAAYKDDLYRMPHGKSLITIAINDDEYAMKNFSGLRKRNLDAPLICYDVSRSCAHRWGVANDKRNLNNTFLRLFEMFEKSVSFNTSAVFGGTSFGHIAGAQIIDGSFYPYATSYDNGAVITENGTAREEYNTYAKAFHAYAPRLGESLIGEVKKQPLVSIPQISFTQYAPLSALKQTSQVSAVPLAMEQCNVGYGAMLYTADCLAGGDSVHISVHGIRDNAQLFINETLVASVSRTRSDTLAAVANISQGDKISVLVDAMGRVGNVRGFKDYKGIVGGVTLNLPDGAQLPLSQWNNTPMPSDYEKISSVSFEQLPDKLSPGIYRATFKRTDVGDSYLFVGSWGRGEVWVNGHSLGRFWNVGPQLMLYLPGCWLHDGDNELLVVDWVGPQIPEMEGFRFAPVY